MTVRWTFYDAVADETYTVPINPDGMTSPQPPAKALQHVRTRADAYYSGGRTVTFMGKPTIRAWEFSGAIRTKEHYDALRDWAAKTNEVTITDHLDRAWLVYITDFVPTDRKPTPRVTWRLRYVVKTAIIERVS